MKVESESNRSVIITVTIAGTSASCSAPTASSSRKTDEKSGALNHCVGGDTQPPIHAIDVTAKMLARKARGFSVDSPAERTPLAGHGRPFNQTMIPSASKVSAARWSSGPTPTSVAGLLGDEPCVLQTDEREQQTDAGGGGDPQRMQESPWRSTRAGGSRKPAGTTPRPRTRCRARPATARRSCSTIV